MRFGSGIDDVVGAPVSPDSSKMRELHAAVETTAPPSDLARLGAAAQLGELTAVALRLKHALRYQLLCKETAYLVVDSASVQGDGLPVLRKVPTMLAAGWGSSAWARCERTVLHCRSVAPDEFDLGSDFDEQMSSPDPDRNASPLLQRSQRRSGIGGGAAIFVRRFVGPDFAPALSRSADDGAGMWPTALDALSRLGLLPASRRALDEN